MVIFYAHSVPIKLPFSVIAIFYSIYIVKLFRLGRVMTVAFELEGQTFTALNGGSIFTFNEAISFQVNCETQDEVDYYWQKLSEGGDEKAQQCGWLKDKYGVSWQIVPTILPQLMADPDTEKSKRAMEAMLKMKKINIDELKRACAG